MMEWRNVCRRTKPVIAAAAINATSADKAIEEQKLVNLVSQALEGSSENGLLAL